MAIMPMSEFDRFMILFDRLYDFTETYVYKTPEDKYDWKPVEGPGVSFGDRLDDVTIKSLHIHLTVSEDGFVRSICEIEEGNEIPLPINKQLSKKLDNGDFITLGRELHTNCMQMLKRLTPEEISRTVWFQGCEYSVMGFLWALYAHYAYHLG
ncbi:MAG: DinB family protein, partial [Kordiimonadaceae bacterium]|nr:DinB family protein [Kordiimonadaceae bacterium]